MMDMRFTAPWHRETYERFFNEYLPQLLGERLPLASYSAEPSGERAFSVRLSVRNNGKEVAAELADLPAPDEDGIFLVDGRERLVLPIASQEELDEAKVFCVGEQLRDYVASQLGSAPEKLAWDESLLRSWLPLDQWITELVTGKVIDERLASPKSGPWSPPHFVRIGASGQVIDPTNWLSRLAHRRRILVANRQNVYARGQLGRVGPFMTPEGTNIGRILSVAAGTTIRDCKLAIVDDRPKMALAAVEAMVPFIEHSDANRLLMGTNMMRQWCPSDDPEPALVQTGFEPNVPDIWCGRNLLTAFASLGIETDEDAIVLSESAAKRMNQRRPLEVGDKLSNRHGHKGTVSRVRPDDEMPHLADGTPVDIVVDFTGCVSRLNFGQIREAVMGRIARAEGKTAVVAPFEAPSSDALRRRLAAAGLPESGMERLFSRRDGDKLALPSTVGYVYWGKTHHLASDKLHSAVTLDQPANMQGFMEFIQLRTVGATETILETFNTRSVDRPDADTLAERVAAGPVEQAAAPSPKFAELARRLAAVGVAATLDGEQLRFSFAPPAEPAIRLARPQPHPWAPERQLESIGAVEDAAGWDEVVEANEQLRRVLESSAPAGLLAKAETQLRDALAAMVEGWLNPEKRRQGSTLVMNQRVLFTGRTVLTPGPGLKIDQLGVAEEIAWNLFGPLVQRELGDAKAAAERTDAAAAKLDEIMAKSWVILNRAPSIEPTSLLAFHPVRIPEPVIRVNPLICPLMNADFDGDQACVLLPITEAGQREAGEKLSVVGHLRRDPGLIDFWPLHSGSPWGLAWLSLQQGGLEKVREVAGVEVAAPEGYVTRPAIRDALQEVLAAHGPERTLEVLQDLTDLGFEVTAASGASVSPFIGEHLSLPAAPEGDDVAAWWERDAAAVAERIESEVDFASEDLGPVLLLSKSGARASMQHLVRLVGRFGAVIDIDGALVMIRHSLRDGLTSRESYAQAVRARWGMGQTALSIADAGRRQFEAARPRGFGVLARAMRSKRPEIVFAHAAAAGEVDPLADPDVRLFVGLRPK